MPPLESRLAQQRNLLTALAGRYPSEEVEETFALAQFSLPRDLPLGLPSRLVAQRPDIKGAEANLHSASAQIGVAVAARLPNVTLSANGATSAFSLAQLFQPGTFGYSFAGNVAQTAFDGMTLYNKQKAAEASFDQAKAQYRDTVVKAFQNVADALRALQSDARSVQSARAAEGTAKKYLDHVRLRLKFGGVSQLEVVDAQRLLSRRGEFQNSKRSAAPDRHGCFVRRARRRLGKSEGSKTERIINSVCQTRLSASGEFEWADISPISAAKLSGGRRTPGRMNVAALAACGHETAAQRETERLELERARAVKRARVERRMERRELVVDRTTGRKRTAARAAGFALISATAVIRTLVFRSSAFPGRTQMLCGGWTSK